MRTLVLVLAAGYGLLTAAVFFLQRSLMYVPSHLDMPPKGMPPFRPWQTADGELIGYVRDAPAAQRVVVLFHGNGGEALDRTWLGGLILSPSVAIVLAEHPGYGARGGAPSEKGLVAAGHAVVAAARDRWRAPITAMGESLGTGVAAAVAGDPGVDRVALVSPFVSALAVAKGRFWFLPVALLMRDPFRSDERLADVRTPLFIIHGTNDDIVPFASGKALFDGYNGPRKWFTEIPGAHHNDMPAYLAQSPAAAAFRAFIRGDPLE